MAVAGTNGYGLESTEYPKRKKRAVFSSVAGFSQPSNGAILTLEDLLRYIQPLDLENYNGPRLEGKTEIGEGASYKVVECKDRYTQKLVAVKRIKLPDIQSNQEAFEHRVECVLRDIEVMHHVHLAQHENILRLLGYGWDYQQGDTIPFLVTELAPYGTLKEYLLQTKTTLRDRFKLCGQVHSGLTEMHLCGISHGDLKLDNVLVCDTDVNEVWAREKLPPVDFIRAKISDFGHSIILSSDEASVKDYRGTLGYKPPEVRQVEESIKTTDVRKCDLWTLGLVCWEILAGGVPYYEDPNVIAALEHAKPEAVGIESAGSSLTSESRRGETLQKSVNAISHLLKDLAQAYVVTYTVPMDELRRKCSQLFENLLQVDASARSPRALPFANDLKTINAAPRQQLVQRAATEKQWSFATFKPSQMALSPSQARLRMFSDFERMALHKDPLQAARAQLHIAFAYGVGFGVENDIKQFQQYLQRSAKNGLAAAKAMLALLRGWRLEPDVEIARYSYRVRAALRELTIVPRLERINSGTSTYESLEDGARKAAQALNLSPIPATIYAVCHNMTGIIPRSTRVNERDPNTGETALNVACRLGRYQAVNDLLNLGADASIPANDGCLPLHWLFMFQQDEVAELGIRLTQDWWIQYLNCVTIKPYVFDGQFPLTLHGSPLAFAVMTKAERAIETLLELGADPMARVEKSGDPDDADWADRAPLYLAARLHFEDIFKQLCDKAVQIHGVGLPEFFVEMAKMMPHSTPLERQIMHGKGYSKASHRMAKRLHKLSIATTGRGQWDSYMKQDSHYAPLEEAIGLMDLEVGKALLHDFYGNSLMARDELLYDCMLKACTGLLTLEESIHLLEFAIEQGCNVNAVLTKVDYQWRAVDFLIEQHQIPLLLWLLKFKPNLARLGTAGVTPETSPLWQVIDDDLSQAVNIELLLEAGANPNLQEEFKSLQTPLHLAVRKNLLEDVRKLCAAGADPDIKDASLESPFQVAVRAGNLEMVREFIPSMSVAGRLDANFGSGATALSQAVALGHSKIAALLLEHGAKIEAAYPTAFHVAASEAQFESLKVLLAASKSFDMRDDKLNTPLQLAIQSSKKDVKGAFNCVTALLEAGANPNTQNQMPAWAIHAVFRYFQGTERYKLVRLFHEKGAQLDVRDTSETSILHLAAFMADRPLVKFLLKAGLSPSLLGNQKQTPLHDCVRSLDQKNGAKAEHVAALCDIMDMLVRAGADIPYQPYLALRVNNFEEAKSWIDDKTGLPPEVSVSLVRKSLAEKVHSSIHKMQEKLQAKKLLEQEERALKVEGTGLLVFRDFKYLTPLEMAVSKKNGNAIAAHLLKLHAETLRRLKTDDKNYITESNVPWHEVVISAAAKKCFEAKNWAVFRHFITNDLPIPTYALSWTTAIALLNHSLQNCDFYLMSMFSGASHELIQADYPRVQYPQSKAPYPWPNILLPADFCANLNRLHNIVYPDNSPSQATTLGDVLTDLHSRAKVYEGIRFPSVTDMLKSSWRIIRNMDLQTASYFFDNDNLSDLIYIVGKSWPDVKDVSLAMPAQLAPAATSTSLRLLFDVWKDPKFSPSRAKNLDRIIGAYTLMQARAPLAVWPLDILQVHVGWLSHARDTEIAKDRYRSAYPRDDWT